MHKNKPSEEVLAADTVRRLKPPEGINIQELPIDQLEEDPDNANAMSEEHFAALVEVVGRVGMLQPVLVRKPDVMPRPPAKPKYKIIDGHHRVRAARAAGLTAVACVIATSDVASAKILQLGMNRLRGEMDLAGVARVFESLHADGFGIDELALTGFGASEISDLLDSLQERNEEDILDGALGGTDDASNEPPVARPFILEVAFATKEELQRVKRALKRAAAGGDMGEGLVNLVDGNGDDNELDTE